VKTILVLEYESIVRAYLRDSLADFEIIEAADAEQVLTLFAMAGHHIDLLVADVTLPRSTGIQVALLLRTKISSLPVLLTADYPVSDWTGRDYTDLERLGSNGVTLLSKPLQDQDVSRAVSELLETVAA